MLAFRLISNPKKLGICVVKDNDRILDGMNRCASGSKLSNSDRRYTFGRDIDDIVYSISDIIGNGANITDEKRIKFETKLTMRTLVKWPSIPYVIWWIFILVMLIAGLCDYGILFIIATLSIIIWLVICLYPCQTLIELE